MSCSCTGNCRIYGNCGGLSAATRWTAAAPQPPLTGYYQYFTNTGDHLMTLGVYNQMENKIEAVKSLIRLGLNDLQILTEMKTSEISVTLDFIAAVRKQVNGTTNEGISSGPQLLTE